MAPPATEGTGVLRLGIFGGTFDPPHVGHVSVARDFADALELDRLVWIPARVPPHKRDVPLTPASVRLEMVRAAASADPRFEVSEIELRRDGPSFTVDTLRTVRAEHPSASIFLALGSDQIGTFAEGWKDPEEILRLCTLALIDRAGDDAPSRAPELPGMERAVHVQVRRVDVSSTEVRDAVAAGRDVRDRVPDGVWAVIAREGLYR